MCVGVVPTTLSFSPPCLLNSTQKWFQHSVDDSKAITAHISQPQGTWLLGVFFGKLIPSLVCDSLKICCVCLFHPVSEAEVTYKGWWAPSVRAPTRVLANTFWRAYLKITTGLPWWLIGKESTCQCRRHGFNHWSGTIPRAMAQLRPCTTIAPVL